jgi:hypothetical protein
MAVHSIADPGTQEAVIPETHAEAYEPVTERRHVSRGAAAFDVWLIGHEASTILRCHCENHGAGGLHLIAPLGYGIAEGQRYELRSRPPEVSSMPDFNFEARRWARVVRTEIVLGEERDRLGVGVEFEE